MNDSTLKKRLFNNCIKRLTERSVRAAEERGVAALQTANNARDEICPHCGAEHSLLNVAHGKRLCSICGMLTAGKLSPVA
jgi:hypothetical protein